MAFQVMVLAEMEVVEQRGPLEEEEEEGPVAQAVFRPVRRNVSLRAKAVLAPPTGVPGEAAVDLEGVRVLGGQVDRLVGGHLG